jgi:hypothetical protein
MKSLIKLILPLLFAGHALAQFDFTDYKPGTGAAPAPTFQAIPSVTITSGGRAGYADHVGFCCTANANMTIKQIGRWTSSGNSLSHTLSVLTSSGGATVLGSVTVNTSGATPNQFLYGTLSSPITVTSGEVLYIVSDESPGGGSDFWFDVAPYTFSTDFTAINAAYGGVGSMNLDVANSSFVPVNIVYTKP